MLSVVKSRMKELGWTNYRLAMALAPNRVSTVTVYDYLRGKSEMTAGKLGHVLNALGLRVVADPEWKAEDRPRRTPFRDSKLADAVAMLACDVIADSTSPRPPKKGGAHV